MIYLSAVAAAIGFRMGLFNIGVEGQYGIASYAAAVFAGAAFLPGPLNVVASLVVAVVVGALWDVPRSSRRFPFSYSQIFEVEPWPATTI